MMSTPSVLIVGADPAGCLSALQFARRGFSVVVYERQSEAQIMDTKGTGRTYIMSLNSRSDSTHPPRPCVKGPYISCLVNLPLHQA